MILIDAVIENSDHDTLAALSTNHLCKTFGSVDLFEAS